MTPADSRQQTADVTLYGKAGCHLCEDARKEIEALRESIARQLKVEPHPYLTVGRRVRIKSGPLSGLDGILIRRKGTYRVVLSIEMILRAVVVDVDLTDIEPL